MNEFELLNYDKNSEFIVFLIDNDIFHWKGIINGPKDSCYATGVFQIDF